MHAKTSTPYTVARSFGTRAHQREHMPCTNLRAARRVAADLSARRGVAFCVHRSTARDGLGTVVAEYLDGRPVT